MGELRKALEGKWEGEARTRKGERKGIKRRYDSKIMGKEREGKSKRAQE